MTENLTPCSAQHTILSEGASRHQRKMCHHGKENIHQSTLLLKKKSCSTNPQKVHVKDKEVYQCKRKMQYYETQQVIKSVLFAE
jgi:hypothetical protein